MIFISVFYSAQVSVIFHRLADGLSLQSSNMLETSLFAVRQLTRITTKLMKKNRSLDSNESFSSKCVEIYGLEEDIRITIYCGYK